jgi:hypothetical protein
MRALAAPRRVLLLADDLPNPAQSGVGFFAIIGSRSFYIGQRSAISLRSRHGFRNFQALA